jgi:hypothetical protein
VSFLKGLVATPLLVRELRGIRKALERIADRYGTQPYTPDVPLTDEDMVLNQTEEDMYRIEQEELAARRSRIE